jgi:hypothetical protein
MELAFVIKRVDYFILTKNEFFTVSVDTLRYKDRKVNGKTRGDKSSINVINKSKLKVNPYLNKFRKPKYNI